MPLCLDISEQDNSAQRGVAANTGGRPHYLVRRNQRGRHVSYYYNVSGHAIVLSNRRAEASHNCLLMNDRQLPLTLLLT